MIEVDEKSESDPKFKRSFIMASPGSAAGPALSLYIKDLIKIYRKTDKRRKEFEDYYR